MTGHEEIVPADPDDADPAAQISAERNDVSRASQVENFLTGSTYIGNDLTINVAQTVAARDHPSSYEERRRQHLDELVDTRFQRHDEFVTRLLEQALVQASTTFRLSMVFLALGGAIVILSAVAALSQPGPFDQASVSFASAAFGAAIGGSGAAFAIRADKARQHLEEQATASEAALRRDRAMTDIRHLLSEMQDQTAADVARANVVNRLAADEDWLGHRPSDDSPN